MFVLRHSISFGCVTWVCLCISNLVCRQFCALENKTNNRRCFSSSKTYRRLQTEKEKKKNKHGINNQRTTHQTLNGNWQHFRKKRKYIFRLHAEQWIQFGSWYLFENSIWFSHTPSEKVKREEQKIPCLTCIYMSFAKFFRRIWNSHFSFRFPPRPEIRSGNWRVNDLQF